MAIIGDTSARSRAAILEDFSERLGHLLVVDLTGVKLDLPKSAEPTSTDPKTLYLGHTLEEFKDSPTDLLGDQILSKPGDPDYAEVAAVFPPIRKMPTYSFVGTDATMRQIRVLDELAEKHVAKWFDVLPTRNNRRESLGCEFPCGLLSLALRRDGCDPLRPIYRFKHSTF